MPALAGEEGYTTLERKWARPTCDVNGLFGGYAGPGPKTVLPCKAGAKLSFRLVPDQDPRTVEALFRAHVRKVTPPGVTVEVITHQGAPAVLVNVDTPGFRAAVRAIEAGFGTKPVFIREGGSIPVVGLLKQHLKVDTLLLGWGQNDDNLHGPNEKFSLADFHRGIKASAHLLAGAGERAGLDPCPTPGRLGRTIELVPDTGFHSGPLRVSLGEPDTRGRLMLDLKYRHRQHRGGAAELPQPERPGRRARGHRSDRRAGGRAEGAARRPSRRFAAGRTRWPRPPAARKTPSSVPR